MHKRKLIIFPFNGNAIEAIDCIDDEEYEFLGFIDDDLKKKSSQYEIFTRTVLNDYQEILLLAVPGSPSTFRDRESHINSLMVSPDRYIKAIHPRASIGKQVTIGYNCLIMAGAVITSNAHLNNHICVLPNSVIHHDVQIDDYTLVGSNVVIAGGTSIGRNCYIGSGTNIINGIQIGNGCLIGLGSNIIESVVEDTMVVGNPGRVLRVF